MTEQRKWTIAVRLKVGEKARKVTKIIGLNGDGFSVLTPYHNARSGYVWKTPISWEKATQHNSKFSWDDTVGFTAENRVKLSYHTDGFAQFSSETPGQIISGRDSCGDPKGLGLMTRSLDDPISSGPTVALTLWGLHDFMEVEDSANVLIFEPDQFYYRACSASSATGLVLSLYCFPSLDSHGTGNR